MEKSRPHYPLSEIQREVARRGAASFTKTALKNGLAMGLTVGQLVDVVRGMTRGNFIKSMTTHQDHTMWQDVYHAMTPSGVVAYVKVTGYTDGSPPVIQFKEKDE
ncbi:type II toxin-antitoxin system MqsR family toxin [Propionivibrio sp.]|uniref:type II toxin-antitoxin system MqsR family toxin n=1 Tax=Propionivibrio sp. TaxID=2212460 RepID=UPI003BF0F83F